MSATKPKSFFPLALLAVVLLVGAVAAAILLGKKSHAANKDESRPIPEYIPSARTELSIPQINQTADEENVSSEPSYEAPEDVSKGATKDEDIPNTAFPSMEFNVDDEDAQLAQAFTYDNLQDSMLTSGREAREAMKSRDAWSRFGQRGNPEIWEAQMEEMKKEIDASGQSIEQFMENTWAPIPEQMAAFWKDAKNSNQANEVTSAQPSRLPSRQALAEAASLTRDATQSIPKSMSSALLVLQDILSARKRAKSLGLSIPTLTKDQKSDLTKWISTSNKQVSGLAQALSNM